MTLTAKLVAEKLAAKGRRFQYIIEPRHNLPGRVQINDEIYVEVPAYSDVVFVVLRHPDGGLDYGRPRKRMAYIDEDISCAIHQGCPRP